MSKRTRKTQRREAQHLPSIQRVVWILAIGMPFVAATYVWALSQDTQSGGRNAEIARQIVGTATGLYARGKALVEGLIGRASSWTVGEEEVEAEVESGGEPFARGSAGRLATMNRKMKLEGMEMSLEDQRTKAREVFRDGRMLVDE